MFPLVFHAQKVRVLRQLLREDVIVLVVSDLCRHVKILGTLQRCFDGGVPHHHTHNQNASAAAAKSNAATSAIAANHSA